MQQRIRFCTAADAVRIAYATAGNGPVLVKVANYLTHLEHDWHSPVWQHWWRGLVDRYTLVRYDERGCGLSDWGVTEFSIDAWVQDLEAVVEAVGLESFPLLGISQGASVSVAYAVKHPDKVSHLILYGGYARGRFHRELTPSQRVEAETMLNVIRVGWGQENSAFRQLFTTQLIPDGSTDQIKSLNELARISTTPANAAAMEHAFYQIDVTDLAPKLKIPTLVVHSRDDAAVPFEEGRELAALIPDARFLPLDGKNHILLESEPAWPVFLQEIHTFINGAAEGVPFTELTERERDVLNLIAQGFSNDEIAAKLFRSPATVRNHITHIFSKLGVESRAQAIVRAREAGLGRREAGRT